MAAAHNTAIKQPRGHTQQATQQRPARSQTGEISGKSGSKLNMHAVPPRGGRTSSEQLATFAETSHPRSTLALSSGGKGRGRERCQVVTDRSYGRGGGWGGVTADGVDVRLAERHPRLATQTLPPTPATPLICLPPRRATPPHTTPSRSLWFTPLARPSSNVFKQIPTNFEITRGK